MKNDLHLVIEIIMQCNECNKNGIINLAKIELTRS